MPAIKYKVELNEGGRTHLNPNPPKEGVGLAS